MTSGSPLPSPSFSPPDAPAGAAPAEGVSDFVRRALDRLDVVHRLRPDGLLDVRLTEALLPAFEGQQRWLLAFDREAFQRSAEADADLVVGGSAFLRGLAAALSPVGLLTAGAPVPAPTAGSAAPAAPPAGDGCSAAWTKQAQTGAGGPAGAWWVTMRVRWTGLETRDDLVGVALLPGPDGAAWIVPCDSLAAARVSAEDAPKPPRLDSAAAETLLAKALSETRAWADRIARGRAGDDAQSLERELGQLKAYFEGLGMELRAQSASGSETVRAEAAERLAYLDRELKTREQEVRERHQGAVEAEVLNAAWLATPTEGGALEVRRGDRVVRRSVRGIPALGVSTGIACDACRGALDRVSLCSGGELLCAACRRPCAAGTGCGEILCLRHAAACATCQGLLCGAHTLRCPETDTPFCRDHGRLCPECRQAYWLPQIASAGRCAACRALQPLGYSDPAAAQLAARPDALGKVKLWLGASNRRFRILHGKTLWNRYVAVLDASDGRLLEAWEEGRMFGSARRIV